MSTNDIFHDARYSINHANRHIRSLETEIAAFFDQDPFSSLVAEPSADGSQNVHKVKLVRPMPAVLSGIAFDAISSLRSSLDQAGYSIARAAGTSGKKAHYPFGDNAAQATSRRWAGSKDLPQDIFDVMLSFEPYKGGNDLLWAMNKLCNSHKHEIIMPVAIWTGSATGEFRGPIGIGTFPPKWDSVKQEMVIAYSPPGSAPSIEYKIETFIAFAEFQGVTGQPAIRVLDKMLATVDGIIVALEAESRKIGIIQ